MIFRSGLSCLIYSLGQMKILGVLQFQCSTFASSSQNYLGWSCHENCAQIFVLWESWILLQELNESYNFWFLIMWPFPSINRSQYLLFCISSKCDCLTSSPFCSWGKCEYLLVQPLLKAPFSQLQMGDIENTQQFWILSLWENLYSLPCTTAFENVHPRGKTVSQYLM